MTQATDMALAGAKRTATRARSTLRRKNLILDQANIDRAKRNLRAATETDTIQHALDAVNDLASFQRAVDAGVDALIGRGGFADYFVARSHRRR